MVARQTQSLGVRKRQPIFFLLSLASCVLCGLLVDIVSHLESQERERETKNKRCNFSDCPGVQTAAACLLDCCLPAYSNQHRLLVGNDAATALGLFFMVFAAVRQRQLTLAS